MKATNRPYSIEASDLRLREILDFADAAFSDVAEIPGSEKLTYDNGFHVECTALFIDIRGSSGLVKKHKTPVLGKIYRGYISECIAVVNQDPNCGEIFIQGDCVGAVFHTPRSEDVDSVFFRAAQLNSLIELLNLRLEQRGYSKISCGIGMAVGRSLMIKAGYKGSGINDVIWMGDVVNAAAKLCHRGSRDGSAPIQVSIGAYERLNAENRALLRAVAPGLSETICHDGDVVSNEMRNWTKAQRGQPDALGKLLKYLGVAPAPKTDGLSRLDNWL